MANLGLAKIYLLQNSNLNKIEEIINKIKNS